MCVIPLKIVLNNLINQEALVRALEAYTAGPQNKYNEPEPYLSRWSMLNVRSVLNSTELQ